MEYIIIVKNTIHIPGDERSKRYPGHGYPAHTETRRIAEIYISKQEFEHRIKKLIENKEDFTAYEGRKLSINSTVTLSY